MKTKSMYRVAGLPERIHFVQYIPHTSTKHAKVCIPPLFRAPRKPEDVT